MSDDATPPPNPAPPSGSGWSGEDATMPGTAGAGTWSGEDATLAGKARPGTWSGEDATMPGTAGAGAWSGEDVTIGGGSTSSDGSGLRPAPAPGTADGALQPRTAAGRAGRRHSDRLIAASDPSARDRLADELRRRDDQWLAEGRPGELTGRTLGDFMVGAMLGEGGMAVVYRARQISLGRRVALKVLPRALAADPVLVERFGAEASSASLVSSPHVVQVFFAGSVAGEIFYAMEYVEGSDLARVLGGHRQAGTLPDPADALRWTAQAARGLAAAAAHRIVHRDIKPQNLLLTADGMVKIADFGIAKVVGEGGLTIAGAAVGTPAYCSPEQGRGDEVDPRSDLYSLGVVLYELLTGRKPFEAATPDALIYQHNFGEPRPPRELAPDLPADHEAACMRLLMKDPAQRYQDAADLADDLERLLAGHDVTIPAYVPKFGTGAEEALRRHGGGRRRLLYLAVAAALVLAVLASVWWWRAQDTTAAELARRRTALAPLDRPLPVPRSAEADLAWMRARLGEANPDVQRWAAKLARVAALRTRLAPLDAAALPGAALRASAAADLRAWQAETGEADPDGRRWRTRLDAAAAEDARLAAELAELDQGPPSLATVERLAPTLAARAALVAADEPAQARWTALITAAGTRAAALRDRLARLDGTDALRAGVLRELRAALADWRTLHGADDAARRWEAALAAREGALAALRDELARLDRVEVAPVPLQLALAPALERLRALADPDDAALARWSARLTTDAARVATLRDGLAQRLDAVAPLRVDDLATCQRLLGDYRALVSGDDGRLLAWERRLTAETQELVRLQAAVEVLLRPGRPAAGELAAARTALPALTALGGLGDEARAAAERRLAEEDALVAGLRRALAGAFASAQAADADALAERVGADDPDVAAWRARAATWRRAGAVLAGLDDVAPLPEGAAEALADYRALVGDSADVQRWAAKLARVDELRAALGGFDRPQPTPPDAIALLDELAERWTGPDDPLVRRGRAQVERVRELRALLVRELDGAAVLPAGGPAEPALDELATLEGEAAPRVADWRATVDRLRGPGRPAWAADAGRDRWGPWCEIALRGARLRLRLVPAGVFRMGSVLGERGRDEDETAFACTLTRSVWMLDSEVTRETWLALGLADPSRFRAPGHPVDSVARADAERFCAALAAAVPGLAPRLPSEAEWERACRAGGDGAYALSLTEGAILDRGDGSAPVRSRQPNRFGLFDLHGNLWEWVADGYAPYPAGAASDPVGRGADGIVRGGSWMDAPEALRAANRVALPPTARLRTVGFRFVVPIP